jgi:Rha family phage regulatory protein
MKIDSRTLAKKLGKTHNNLLKDVRSLANPLLRPTQIGFHQTEYLDDTGRYQPMFELEGEALITMLRRYANRNEKAFSLLAECLNK